MAAVLTPHPKATSFIETGCGNSTHRYILIEKTDNISIEKDKIYSAYFPTLLFSNR
jgi:hypothetical protein